MFSASAPRLFEKVRAEGWFRLRSWRAMSRKRKKQLTLGVIRADRDYRMHTYFDERLQLAQLHNGMQEDVQKALRNVAAQNQQNSPQCQLKTARPP